MNIRKLHHLKDSLKVEIEHLVQTCLVHDGLERTLYLHNDINFYENLDSFYLLYDNNKLASVLTIFQPIQSEAEISAYTLPEERGKGYFTALLDIAEDELVGYDIFRILFVVEPQSKNINYVLKSLAAKYRNSEYLLILILDDWNSEYHDDLSTAFNYYSMINLIEVQSNNLRETVELISVIFNMDMETAISLVSSSMETEQMKVFCVYTNQNMIGTCSINYGTSYASIFNLGIAPQYQGNGYGRLLLNKVLYKMKQQKLRYVSLEVGSVNIQAYSLYKSVGFQIKTQYDYYEYVIQVCSID